MWIEDAVQHVGEQVDDNERHNQEQQCRLDDGVVAVPIASRISRPSPGHEKTDSTTTAPPSSRPNCKPRSVTTGIQCVAHGVAEHDALLGHTWLARYGRSRRSTPSIEALTSRDTAATRSSAA